MKKKMLLAGLTSLVCSFRIIFAEGESAKTTITADAPVADVCFSADWKNVINVSSTDNFGDVKARDIASGKLKVIKGYDDTSVYGCSLSPDGTKFATISRDEQVKI